MKTKLSAFATTMAALLLLNTARAQSNLPPAILAQPQSITVSNGGFVNFYVSVTGTQPLTLQWQRYGTNLLYLPQLLLYQGVNTTNLSFKNAGPTNAGPFDVVITNAYGAVTSSIAILTVAYPPVITNPPAGLLITSITNVSFSVGATGTGPFTYQWLLNGKILTNNLITTVAGGGSANNYPGDGGPGTNTTLNQPNGIAVDSAGNLFIADRYHYRIRELYTNGIITTVAGNGGYGSGASGVLATNTPLGAPAGVAVDPWDDLVIADTANNRVRFDEYGFLVTLAGTGATGYSGDGGPAYNAALDSPCGVAVDLQGNIYIADTYNGRIRRVDINDNITTVAGRAGSGSIGDGGAATNALLQQPQAVAVDNAGNLYIADTLNNRIRRVDTNGIITTIAGNGNSGFNGDGIAATNAWLNHPAGLTFDSFGNLFIADMYNSRVRKVTSAGIISTVAGQGRFGFSGDGGAATNATFEYPAGVAVDGGGVLYISDSENNRIRKVTPQGPVYTLPAATAANAGNYQVIISSAWGSVTSSIATLAADIAPYITQQPTNQNIVSQNSGYLSVIAGGSTPLGYQWQFNGGNLQNGNYYHGTTNSNLMIFSMNPPEAGLYNVIITNNWGSVTSTVAAISIVYPPGITNEPAAQTTINGSNTLFTVTATGTEPLSYQWQFDGTNLTDTGNISGSATPNLFVTGTTPDEAGSYDVVVGNAWGAITSSVVALTVVYPPAITNQPAAQMVLPGGAASFSVAAGGTGPLACQWQLNGVNLTDGNEFLGSATTNLVVTGVSTNDAGLYDVVVTSAWGSVTSSVAPLTIVYPPAITSQPVSQAMTNGGGVAFSVGATGTMPLVYQWQFNGTNLSDQNEFSGSATTNLFITGVSAGDAGNYDVVITNAWGSATSSVAMLTIAYPPTIAVQPTNQYALAGGTAVFSVAPAGTAPFTCQWMYNGANLTDGGGVSGSATANLVISGVSPNNAGTYNVVIQNNWGAISSAAATLNLAYPPVITTPPTNTVVLNGGNTGMSATVSATPPWYYQWQFNGNNQGGAEAISVANATLLLDLPDATTNNAGSYAIVVTNAWGSITSSIATLTIAFAPSIVKAPVEQFVPYGSNATISVQAAGTAPLSYRWTLSQTNLVDNGQISGSSTPTLTILQASTNNGGIYDVYVSNAWGQVSTGAELLMGAPPTITSQPVNATAVPGKTASFSVAASGNQDLHYQWQFNGTNLSGQNNPNLPTLTLEQATTTNAGAYDVVVTNFWGSATSHVASLTIAYPPVITSQPLSVLLTNFGTATFSVGATGTGPFTYQWVYNSKTLLPNRIITTVAGDGTSGWSGDNGLAVNSELYHPVGLALDAIGDLYIGDYFNNRVRKVNPAGVITTVAGGASAGYNGNGNLATNSWLNQPAGLALDGDGNLIIADSNNNRIRTVIYDFLITLAGNGSIGYYGDGGPAYNAYLNRPSGVTVDAAGNIYIADTYNQRIRKVDLDDNITTYAGKGLAGYLGDGGAATNAELYDPEGVVMDPAGNLYIADTYNSRIRKVDTNGIITTVAGRLGNGYSGDFVNATNSSLNEPSAVALDTNGNLYIADTFNQRIRMVNLSVSNIITTVAGNGQYGYSGDGSWSTNASVYDPSGVAVDARGDLYIADTYNSRVRVVTPQGPTLVLPNVNGTNAGTYQVIVSSPWASTTSMVASLTVDLPPSITRQPVSQNAAAGTNVSFSVSVSGTSPFSYQWLFNGVSLPQQTFSTLNFSAVSITNAGSYQVVVSNSFGVVTSSNATLTVAYPPVITVQPQSVTVNPGQSASFSAVVAGGPTLYFQWYFNGAPLPGQNGTNLLFTNVTAAVSGAYYLFATNFLGSATSSRVLLVVTGPPVFTSQPAGGIVIAGGTETLAATAAGTGPLRYQWQYNGANLPGQPDIITTVAGNGSKAYAGDGGPAVLASLNVPYGLAVDNFGNLYIADSLNNRVRRIDVNGDITTFAGDGTLGYSGDGGPATNANLCAVSVALDPAGNLYIADQRDSVIRRVDTNGLISTFAGNGNAGHSGDGGSATNASLRNCTGVAADNLGNLYIADQLNSVIRRVDANGIITTVAGNGTTGYSGDGGSATNAALNDPFSVSTDSRGRIFIVEENNNAIRMVDTNGVITTVAGNGTVGFSGDGGAATNANLNYPYGAALDTNGNLYISDLNNQRVRRVDTNGIITTFAGSGVEDYLGDGGAATNAAFYDPTGLAVDRQGDVYISDTYNEAVREVAQLTGTPVLTLTNLTAASDGAYELIAANGYGSVTSSIVNLTVSAVPVISGISLSPTGVTLSLVTTPTNTSRVLMTTNLTPPVLWQTIYTGTPGANGTWQFTDTNRSAARFYQTVTP